MNSMGGNATKVLWVYKIMTTVAENKPLQLPLVSKINFSCCLVWEYMSREPSAVDYVRNGWWTGTKNL